MLVITTYLCGRKRCALQKRQMGIVETKEIGANASLMQCQTKRLKETRQQEWAVSLSTSGEIGKRGHRSAAPGRKRCLCGLQKMCRMEYHQC